MSDTYQDLEKAARQKVGYSPVELKAFILPILQSMPKGDEDRVADAIVEIIEQDREVYRRSKREERRGPRREEGKSE
jgi:hypothetical protein